ncbi:Glutamate-1-semialdehyde 2,1-aminomutase 1 [Frankliniella fusca]|uniref:Glutamate-1-semialdehyde 2,1-aminomutase 1 n=1 Tax=Frankliniella fusca TaxID=407009 RepID=A0AAE1HSJ0_9NEOP|nr:Glutamate-1-semialdehyde 2,1-aminomutase 1 [Frankliniella fusca]
MRLLKCRGGVTRGRGLTKSSVTQFILTRHALVDLSAAIEEYSGVHTGTSEQHVELRVGRQERDCRDLKKFCNWLKNTTHSLTGEGITSAWCASTPDSLALPRAVLFPCQRTGAPPHKAKDAPDQKSQFYFNKMVTLDLTQDDLKRFFT